MELFELKPVAAKKVVVNEQPFFVKSLTALERDYFEQQWGEYKASDSVCGIRAFLVAFCLCDKDGKQTNDSGKESKAKQDFLQIVEKLNNTPAKYIQPVFNAASELNGFSSTDVEELEKN